MADAADETSLADLEEGVNVFFLLVCTVLILMMQAGFALYEVGTIARTPVEVILIKNVMDASIAYASWFGLGNTFAGNGNGFIGSRAAGSFLSGDEYNGDDSPLANMQFLFYAMFAGTAVTVMSGSVADRVPYLLYAIYAVFTCVFSFPVVAHWAWSQDGWMSPVVGAIGNCGVLDFAGSGVVHLFAGTASCAWAYILKPRRGRFNKSAGKVTAVYYGDGFDLQDRTHQALGVFLLWMGWYGFNCGSALSITSRISSQIVSIVAVNTTISPVVCSLTSVAIEWAYFEDFLHARSHFIMGRGHNRDDADREQRDLHSAAINGILSGLVSITAGCATTDPRLTMVIGVVAAFVYHYSYRWQLHRGLDDAVNAVPVHGYCGIWGLLSAALCFAPGRHDALMSAYGVDESSGSCGRGNQFLANLAFAAVVVVWSAVTSIVLFYAVKLCFENGPLGPYLNPLDEDAQPQLSVLSQTVDAIERFAVDAQQEAVEARADGAAPAVGR